MMVYGMENQDTASLAKVVGALWQDVQNVKHALNGHSESGHSVGMIAQLGHVEEQVTTLTERVNDIERKRDESERLKMALQAQRDKTIRTVAAVLIFLQSLSLLSSSGGLTALAKLLQVIP